jgi:hypothetical protein
VQITIFYTFNPNINLSIVSLTLHQKYKNQEKAVLQLLKSFFVEGNLIVKGSRNTIKSFDFNGEKVNVKFFKKPTFVKAIVYSFFRSSKAKRSFEYANYLLQHFIKTPFPIAYYEERNAFGLLKDSFYVSQHIDYNFTIRELIHDPLFPNRKIILEQFTEFTFLLHEAKVNFLDHSPGNTLVVDNGNLNYDFYLIDLNRMKFEEMSLQKRMDNFKKMWLSKQMIQIVAKKYAELYNKDEQLLHSILLEKSTQFKRKIAKKKWLKRKMGKSY